MCPSKPLPLSHLTPLLVWRGIAGCVPIPLQATSHPTTPTEAWPTPPEGADSAEAETAALECDSPEACEDGDACTTDTCEDGRCVHTGLPDSPLGLFDLALLTDPETLDLEVLSTETVWEAATAVTVSEIRFTSYESEACALLPLRLEAYVALPAGREDLPGLLLSHGLGGCGTADAASGPAAEHGLAVLAYSGPGAGQSEGTTSTPDHLFDTVHSPRDSWFWEHSAAAIRALTVLESWQGVDASRLAMVGSSAGGLATLLVNGVDDRLDAAVAVSATGYLDLAVAATPTPGWEVNLLAAMDPPTTPADPAWSAYEDWLDPRHFLATAQAPTLLLTGAQDEFFPITSAVATFDALPADATRVLHIPDWDHGGYGAYDDEAAAALINADLGLWLGHHLGTEATFAAIPPQPVLVTWRGPVVQVDPGIETSAVDAAFCWSADGLDYQTTPLREDKATGLWGAVVEGLDDDSAANRVAFATVTYTSTDGAETFTLSTRAVVPEGFPLQIQPAPGS